VSLPHICLTRFTWPRLGDARDVAHVSIKVYAALYANGVFGDESLEGGRVVPRSVVVEPRLVVLPRRVLRGVAARCPCDCRLAERLVGLLDIGRTIVSDLTELSIH
jgi:hypothetical protein